MKAYYIYPEDIKAPSQWSEQWIIFIKKLGWDGTGTPWGAVLVAPIETN